MEEWKMKRFSKFQKISSLVLALIMTLSLAMPYMGTVKAADDTTGWTTGGSSTVTGNATDGWKLSLSGTGLDNSNNTCYSSDYKVADLRVLMDLSTMTDGQEFWLSFGYGREGFSSWNGTRLLFCLTRRGDQLELYGHNGSKELGKTTIDFKFNKTHAFEFLKTESGWQFAIDGVVYPMGTADSESVNYFWKYMTNTLGAKVKVGFIARKSATCVINNVKIGNKTLTPDSNDTTGWQLGGSSTVAGNPTDGWKLSLSGTALNDSNNTCYSSDYKVADLRVLMDLSTMTDGQEFWLSFGYKRETFASWNGTRLLFCLTRKGDQLELYGHNGSKELGKTTIDFKFNKTHTFEFLKDSNDQYQFAIDGTMYPMGTADSESVHYFWKYMTNTLGAKVKVGFIARKSATCVINNVKIGDKTLTAVDNDTNGWTAGTSSTVTGNPTDGWKLDLAGDGLTSADNTIYQSSYKVADLRVLMDLSTMQDGQEIWLYFGYNREGLASWNGIKLIFALTRKGDTLYFYGHNNVTELGKYTIDFDFSKTHVFEFLKDSNGQYQFAIDGTMYPMGTADNESVHYFWKYMTNTLGASVKVGIMRRYHTACTVNNIKIVPKADAMGATIATQFEENVPIRMGFNYTTVKKYIGSETLVNYGAVLVSKEATAAEMQGALKTALAQGKNFTGTTYSADKKFMFTAGSAEVVPDEYAVIINNSDKVEYMDRNISAIGYIVTKASDGTYKYYFTTNVDDSKNITNGAISKSVTELLKIACEQYLEVYDVAGAEDKKTLEDVIDAFNNEQSCEYTVETLRALITSGLAAAGTEEGNLQREFLKYVHLGVRNGVPTVLSVADYGAVGDGKTDNTAAVAKVLAAAQETQKKTLIVM